MVSELALLGLFPVWRLPIDDLCTANKMLAKLTVLAKIANSLTYNKYFLASLILTVSNLAQFSSNLSGYSQDY